MFNFSFGSYFCPRITTKQTIHTKSFNFNEKDIDPFQEI